MEERIQKIMAKAGIASRRACEEYILAGRVKVNGQTAEIGQKADPFKDHITFDGKRLKEPEQLTYLMLNKPRFVLSTVEAEKGDTRQTVRDLVPAAERVFPVGRLDFESEGLILMTNDGELAQKLTHPSHGHNKEYSVLLARQPDAEQLETWRRGVVLADGYKTKKVDVRITSLSGKGAWVKVVMHEGRKRQIRETASILGLPVVRILRVRVGTLRLGTLKTGEYRELTEQEVDELKNEKAFTKRPDKKSVKPRKPAKKSGTTKKEEAKKFIRGQRK